MCRVKDNQLLKSIIAFWDIMIGIILAGGYATRLKPLTETQPKHLLPINDRPMIEYLFDELVDLPITHYYLVTNNKFAHNFEEWLEKQPQVWRNCITIVNDGTTSNEDRLGSLGDIKFVLDEYNIEDDLFVFGADNITDFPFSKLVSVFNETQKPVVGVYDVKDLVLATQFGVMDVDEHGRIASFEEKPAEPKSTLISTLFYVLPKEVKQSLVKCCELGMHDKAGNLIAELVSSDHVYAVAHDGYWFDIGTHETYKQAQEYFEMIIETED